MYGVKNLTNNKNLKPIASVGGYTVLEHQRDLSIRPEEAQDKYFAAKMNIRRRQLLVQLQNSGVIVQNGAMQWTVGNVVCGTGIKGAGDLIGKAITSKMTKESTIKPEYSGTGMIMLEPTYKHILLINVEEWGSIVLEDGLFLACGSNIKLKATARSTVSSAVLGGEGLFNLTLEGSGIAALESPAPKDELIEFTLDNDELKIDGNMAIAWSNSLKFTVERSSKSLAGSVVNGEGLVNVFRGSGRLLMAPTAKETVNIVNTPDKN